MCRVGRCCVAAAAIQLGQLPSAAHSRGSRSVINVELEGAGISSLAASHANVVELIDLGGKPAAGRGGGGGTTDTISKELPLKEQQAVQQAVWLHASGWPYLPFPPHPPNARPHTHTAGLEHEPQATTMLGLPRTPESFMMTTLASKLPVPHAFTLTMPAMADE